MLLDKHNIYIQPINYPTVPKGTERLRITPTPLHDDAMIADAARMRWSSVWAELELPRERPQPKLTARQADHRRPDAADRRRLRRRSASPKPPDHHGGKQREYAEAHHNRRIAAYRRAGRDSLAAHCTDGAAALVNAGDGEVAGIVDTIGGKVFELLGQRGHLGAEGVEPAFQLLLDIIGGILDLVLGGIELIGQFVGGALRGGAGTARQRCYFCRRRMVGFALVGRGHGSSLWNWLCSQPATHLPGSSRKLKWLRRGSAAAFTAPAGGAPRRARRCRHRRAAAGLPAS